MITKSELEKLLASTETYRVERTKSTTAKDKFGEAVCAFANDMPDCGKPGYLFGCQQLPKPDNRRIHEGARLRQLLQSRHQHGAGRA